MLAEAGDGQDFCDGMKTRLPKAQPPSLKVAKVCRQCLEHVGKGQFPIVKPPVKIFGGSIGDNNVAGHFTYFPRPVLDGGGARGRWMLAVHLLQLQMSLK